ncbi:unnamed protein product [Amoebophrya sp. A25]|nr:unnamed protein product [Amoebophrya sp. A25]|eukprot:GSA25T00005030001.1
MEVEVNSAEANPRFYRTGDVGEMMPNAGIRIKGRRDWQVKLGGVRVELEEIEARLLQPCCHLEKLLEQATCVVVRSRASSHSQETEAGNTACSSKLVLCVTLRDFSVGTMNAEVGSAGTQNDVSGAGGWIGERRLQRLVSAVVRQEAAKVLPRQWMPREVCVFAEMPLTSNGKVDRKALRASLELTPLQQGRDQKQKRLNKSEKIDSVSTSQDGDDRCDGSSFESCSSRLTAWEMAIAEIWAAELGLSSGAEIEPEDNFFQLGSDSLGALRVCRRLIALLYNKPNGSTSAKTTPTSAVGDSADNTVSTISKSSGPPPAVELQIVDDFGTIYRDELTVRFLLLHPVLRDYAGGVLDAVSKDPVCISALARILQKEDRDRVPIFTTEVSTGRLMADDYLLRTAVYFNLPHFVEVLLKTSSKVGGETITTSSDDVDDYSKQTEAGEERPGKRRKLPPATTALHIASQKGYTGVVKLLCQHLDYVEIQRPDANGVLALHLSANLEILELICARLPSSYLTARDRNRQTILHFLARRGDASTLKVLLREEENKVTTAADEESSVVPRAEQVDSQKASSTTALLLSNRDQQSAPQWPVGTLHYFDSRVDWRDKWHRTPLSWAILNGHEDCVRVLLQAKANPNSKVKDGKHKKESHLVNESALELAQRVGFAERLSQTRADLEAQMDTK